MKEGSRRETVCTGSPGLSPHLPAPLSQSRVRSCGTNSTACISTALHMHEVGKTFYVDTAPLQVAASPGLDCASTEQMLGEKVGAL